MFSIIFFLIIRRPLSSTLFPYTTLFRSPSSTDERLAMTAAACRGFVYAASTMGVTGVRSSVDSHARELVARTRAAGGRRGCVGLGVATGDRAAAAGEDAGGVIGGAAPVRARGAPDPAAA